MAATEVEATSELPLKFKTSVLKVSIHCQGCRREVKKVLRKVEGVYSVDIDAKQQKVTVTGNVDAETLVKKLIKFGKHADVWPGKAEQKEKKPGKSKNKEKKNDSQQNSTKEAGHGGDDKEKTPPVSVELVQEPPKNKEASGGASDSAPKNNETAGGGADGAQTDGGTGTQTIKESNSEENKPATSEADNQSPPSMDDGKGGGADKVVSNSDGGEKKENGRENGNHVEGAPSTGRPASGGSPNHNSNAPPSPDQKEGSPPIPNQNVDSPPTSAPTNQIRPHQREYNYYPPPYHAPPPLVYSASYNTVHPSSSYTASYHPGGIIPSYSAPYSYRGPTTQSSPYDLDSYTPQPLDSFEMFSDENPNACSIM